MIKKIQSNREQYYDYVEEDDKTTLKVIISIMYD